MDDGLTWKRCNCVAINLTLVRGKEVTSVDYSQPSQENFTQHCRSIVETLWVVGVIDKGNVIALPGK